LQIGGSETLSAASLEAFDYVALGHLHRPQTMSDDRLVYPGSLFPYSSSEASQDKGFRCIEIIENASGRKPNRPALQHSFHAFAEQRRLRVHRGHFEELLRGELDGSLAKPGDAGAYQPDYVVALLEDSQLPFEAFRRLQQVFPALLHVSRAWKDAEASTRTEELRMRREMSEAELIGSFISQYARQPIDPADQSWLLEELHEFLRAQEGHEAK
jgi:exonuclease SbcD